MSSYKYNIRIHVSMYDVTHILLLASVNLFRLRFIHKNVIPKVQKYVIAK